MKQFSIIWFATASIAIECENDKILIDPFIPLPHSQTIFDADLFTRYNNILITHGHIDHISTLSQTLAKNDAIVYATKTPCQTLSQTFGVTQNRLHEIKTSEEIHFGEISVKVLRSRHVKFDTRLVLSTLFSFRMLKYRKNLQNFLKLNKKCVENNETVCYEINAAEKKILLFGSLSFEPTETYPKCDILILPFQGSSYLSQKGLQLVDMVKPSVVILDHFDDTFPPISRNISSKKFVALMKKKHSDVQVILPQSCQEIKF